MPGNFLVILLPILLLVLLFNAQRKRTRQAGQLQAQAGVGSKICTTSGMFGTIVELGDSDFLLEVAPGVKIRFDRRAIGLVVPSEQDSSTHEALKADDQTDEEPHSPPHP